MFDLVPGFDSSVNHSVSHCTKTPLARDMIVLPDPSVPKNTQSFLFNIGFACRCLT
jgi:hypothetical protein